MRKDKARDIARGVLPSTARKSARDNKRNFHAVQRHAQRQANHAIARHLTDVDDDGNLYTDVDLYDDFEAPEVFDGYNAATTKTVGWSSNMKGIVRERRNADKLGPLLAWARATEAKKMKGWSNVDKVNYFKAILPDTVSGRHALDGHLIPALGLETDEFKYGLARWPLPESLTNNERKDRLRSNLTKHLATTKSRRALREFLYETVPVAAHSAPSNNTVTTREQARDENGNLRYILRGERVYDDTVKRFVIAGVNRAYMVDVQIPQMIAASCDDCSFLRNDPLATPAAVNRFVDIIWGAFNQYRRHPYRRFEESDHSYMREVANYVHGDK
jgi:hypothetical protein